MNPSEAEAVNGCIVISALVTGAIAVVIGIATRDLRSALIVGLSLLAVAITVSLYIRVGEWDTLVVYSVAAAICALALFVLQVSRNEAANWLWKLAWFLSILFHGIVFTKALEWRRYLHGKIAGFLALLFIGVGLFVVVSPLQ